MILDRGDVFRAEALLSRGPSDRRKIVVTSPKRVIGPVCPFLLEVDIAARTP
jgi:hypothetical protein